MKKASYRSAQEVGTWRSPEIPLEHYAYSNHGESYLHTPNHNYLPPVREPNNWNRPSKDYSNAGSGRGDWAPSYADNQEYLSWNAHASFSSSYNQAHHRQGDAHGRGTAASRPTSQHRGDDMDQQWHRGAENTHGWEANGPGWAPRGNAARSHSLVEPPPPPPPPPPPAFSDGQDRTWEPAPGWKNSHRDDDYQPSRGNYTRPHNGMSSTGSRNGHLSSYKTGGQTYSQPSKAATSKKNHQTPSSSKGKYPLEADWRSRDDSDFNNWTRRSSSSSKHHDSESPSRHKQHRRYDYSPPHNRSPDSAFSQHSHGRSRSPVSPPPQKRRKYDDDVVEATSSTYHSHRYAAPEAFPASRRHRSRRGSDSPQHEPERERGRDRVHRKRRSMSSASSRSRSTRSPSPTVTPKAMHRLPSATVPVIRFPPPQEQNIAVNPPGKKKKKNKNANKQNNASMAPPLPLPIPPKPLFVPAPSVAHDFDLDPNARVFVPKKSFKPIGTTNHNNNIPGQKAPASSLSRFFPGDEEETDTRFSQSLPAKPPYDWPTQSSDNHRNAWQISESPTPYWQSLRHTDVLTGEGFADINHETNSHRPETSEIPPVVVARTPPGKPPSPLRVARTPPGKPPSPSVKARTATPPPEPEPMEVDTPQEPPTTNQSGTTPAAIGNDNGNTSGHGQDLGLYHFVSQVGEGTFGKVYKVLNMQTGVHVALKRIRMEAEKDGFPVTAMREIKLLQSLNHDNVIRLFEMLVQTGSVYMVFEYMDHDLTGILSQSQFTFSPAHLKSLNQQMLLGLEYLHRKGVIHRDIKGSNILLNNRGELKLADFGLARFYQKRRRVDYTNRVITLWYRPPELLFGATVYGPEVDMWSAGCIMLELYTKKPVFQGNDEIHQLDTIYRIIGTPDVDRWPDIGNLPWYELVKPKERVANSFREIFSKWMSPPALDLAAKLLDYDPLRRISAADALQTPYFLEDDPKPEMPVRLATVEGEWHELETKREKAKKRKKE